MTKNLMAGLAALSLSLLPLYSLQAQTAPGAGNEPAEPSSESLEGQSRQAFAEGRALQAYEANMALHKRFPHDGDYMYNIVRAAALMDRKSEAYEMMLVMQRQGLSYDFNQSEDTVNIRRTELYQYINNILVEAGKPVGEGAVAFRLAGRPDDFRAVTWDPSREKFLVGTAAEGAVLAVGPDGSSEVLIKADSNNGLWSVHGLAVDPDRNRLWVSSAATERFGDYSPTDQNIGALFEFRLDSLEPVARFMLPIDARPHELGSLAVTDQGHVYAIDRASPIVYLKAPESDRLEAFVANWKLGSFSDIAVTPDNSRLFVAEPRMGVFVVDPVGKQAAMLKGPDTLNLSGIEGVEYVNGQLIVVQGGLKPQRLMRLTLDANGSAVETVSPMAVALPEFSRPGIGTLQGQDLYYLANPGAGAEAAELVVLRTPLDAGQEIVAPDMRLFQEKMNKKSGT